jgi:hypothetical protein
LLLHVPPPVGSLRVVAMPIHKVLNPLIPNGAGVIVTIITVLQPVPIE